MSQTIFLTVHGTFDGVSNPNDPRWWEPNSTFWKTILASTPGAEISGMVKPFVWSGMNSAFEREVAARALVKELMALRKTCDNIHLIGHSHGGNVIEDALERLGWDGAKKQLALRKDDTSKIRSVTTLGTPFLLRHEPMLRKLLIFLMLMLLIITIPTALYSSFSLMMVLPLDTTDSNNGLRFTYLISFTLVIVIFMLPVIMLALRNRHALRFRRKGRVPANWLSIFHPQDEAIFLLSSASGTKYEFYQPGVISANIRRKLDTAVIFVAALAMLFFVLGVGIAILLPQSTHVSWLPLDPFSLSSIPVNVLLLSGSFLVVLRLIARFLDALLRNWANTRIRTMLRDISFGEDHYVRLSAISPVPFVYDCTGFALSGPAEQCMLEDAKASFIAFVNNNYQGMSWQTANRDAIGDMLMGLTTVKTIHSAYFRHPDVVAMVADHLRRSEPEPQPAAAY